MNTTIKAIHQFHHGVDDGDGVTNSLLFVQKILRSLGFESHLYAANIPSRMAATFRSYEQLANCNSEETLLLQHHSMGHDLGDWLSGLSLKRVLVYHNITPPQFFSPGSDYRRYAELGRAQLQQWREDFYAILAVSNYNADDLVALGYHRASICVIPALVDMGKPSPDLTKMPNLSNSLHSELDVRPALLFVGRIVENKRQHLLVEMLWHLHHFMEDTEKERLPMLILAGGGMASPYGRFLNQRLHQLHLDGSVVLAGKVSDDMLQALYQQSAAFVCASAHEGFGMPLVEAMQADCPVVAMESTNIPHTLGEGGLILDNEDPAAMAAVVAILLEDSQLREQVLEGQHRSLSRYSPAEIRGALADWLTDSLGISLPSSEQLSAPPQ